MTQFEIDKERIEKAMEAGERTRLEIELNPEMVEWLLGKNSQFNRKPTPVRVADLMEKIQAYGFLQVEDLHLYSGDLINGQHRLLALHRLFEARRIIPPFPRSGIVVNISMIEAKMIDTGQTRKMQQRLFMLTGIKYSCFYTAAVRFEHEYQFGKKKHYLDEEIAAWAADPQWQKFAEIYHPEKTIENTASTVKISVPIYVAIKQFWQRASGAQWLKFRDEFRGENTSRPVLLLRDLAIRGFSAVKGNGDVSRTRLYRLSVNLLKAYLAQNYKVRIKESDWN